MSTDSIYNFIRVNERILTGGQPTAEQLRAAAEEGIQAVINLATYNPEHSLENEQGLVQSLGMAYYPIPVIWDQPKEADFEAFEAALDALGDQKVLIHCAANYRVTAFYSLYGPFRRPAVFTSWIR